MASVKNITTSELLEALRTATGAHVNPDDVYTASEISEASSASLGVVRAQLSRLKQSNLLECVKVQREFLDGRRALVPGYRFRGRRQ